MTRKEWLLAATEQLAATSSPRLDSELLLSFCLGIDRTHLLASVNELLTDAEKSTLDTLLDRRLHHEPIAYITGYKEFYGRKFFVTPDVLIPRPETEGIVERALPHVTANTTVVDVGTGSGVLAVTLKCERPRTTVIATEISQTALSVAQKNSAYHDCDISFIQTNIMDGINNADMVLANLPYVTDTQSISPAATYEPRQALFSGDDGLTHYRQLFYQLSKQKRKPQHLICEADPQQRGSLEQIAKRAGYELVYYQRLVYEFTLEG